MGYGIVQQAQRFFSFSDQMETGDIVVFTPLSEDIMRDIATVGLRIRLHNLIMNSGTGNSATSETANFFPVFQNGAITSKKITINARGLKRLKLLSINAPFTGPIFRGLFCANMLRENKQKIQEAAQLINLVIKETEKRGLKFIMIFLPRISECAEGQYSVDISSFPYHDIMNFFPKDKDKLKLLTFGMDHHWNVNGHRMAAGAIVDVLLLKGVINRKYLRDYPDVRK